MPEWVSIKSPITKLNPNEVFVFGSNIQGIHGLGAAAMAFFGTARPSKAQRYQNRKGDVGNWAIWGQGSGLMQGSRGASYGIPTVSFNKSNPITLEKVYHHIYEFWGFMLSDNSDRVYLITPVGTSLAGYKFVKMDELWDRAIAEHGQGVPEKARFLNL